MHELDYLYYFRSCFCRVWFLFECTSNALLFFLPVLMTQFAKLKVHHRPLPTLWLLKAPQLAARTDPLFLRELQFASENCAGCITAALLQRHRCAWGRPRNDMLWCSSSLFLMLLGQLVYFCFQVERNNWCSNATWNIICGGPHWPCGASRLQTLPV